MSNVISPEQQTRVLIIEDEPHIRKFLRISLIAQKLSVSEARTGQAGIDILAGQAHDLLVLDLGLPDMDGLQVIKTIRSWSNIPIIILSVRSDESEKIDALDAGANDYVTKPFGIGELMARVRALLRNSPSADTTRELRFGSLYIDPVRRFVCIDGKELNPTRKEYDLLAVLAARPNHVITHKQILEAVWGKGYAEDTHRLRVLIAQLRARLSDTSEDPRYIQTVQGVGYRLLHNAES
jgi:two-component system KDP operon response regulator KdpE